MKQKSLQTKSGSLSSDEHKEPERLLEPSRSLVDNQRSTQEIFNLIDAKMESSKPIKVITSAATADTNDSPSKTNIEQQFASCPPEFREVAENGVLFLKHSGARSHGLPEAKTVKIIFEERTYEPICIAWGSGSTMSFKDIRLVIQGIYTPTFMQKSEEVDPENCFSIVTKHRILDLEHDDVGVVNQWVRGLHFLIGQSEEDAKKLAEKIRKNPPNKLLYCPPETPPGGLHKLSNAVELTRNQSWQSARRTRDRRGHHGSDPPQRRRNISTEEEMDNALKIAESLSLPLTPPSLEVNDSALGMEAVMSAPTPNASAFSGLTIQCENIDSENSSESDADGEPSFSDSDSLRVGDAETPGLLSPMSSTLANSPSSSSSVSDALKRSISTFNVAANLSFVQSAQLTKCKSAGKTPLNELIITEDTYVEALRGIFSKFLVPLRKISHNHPKLFQKLESCLAPCKIILHFHEKFICDLLDLVINNDLNVYISNPEAVANVFTKRRKQFSAYKLYINRYAEIQEALTKLKVTDSLVEEWLATQPSFEQYLLHPIQRIPRYVLLVKEMIKASSKKAKLEGAQAENLSPLQSARDFLEDITDFLNKNKKRMEVFNRLSELMETMINLPEGFWRTHDLGQEERILIYEDITKRKKRAGLISRISQRGGYNQRFFLFDDCVVLTDNHYRVLRVDYFYFTIDVWRDGCKVCVSSRDVAKPLVLVAEGEGKADDWFHRIANLYERSLNEKLQRKGGFMAQILGMSVNQLLQEDE